MMSTNESNNMKSASISSKLIGSRQKPKLVIKNFKVKPKISSNHFENSINELRDAVKAIHDYGSDLNDPLGARLKINYSLEHLYKLVENLCLNGFAERTHNELKSWITRNVQFSLASRIIEQAKKFEKNVEKECLDGKMSASLEWLRLVCRQYFDVFSKQLLMIRSIFMYLDRTYLLVHSAKNPSIQCIWELGIGTFRKHVLEDKTVTKLSINAILLNIKADRNGQMSDLTVLRSILRVYNDVGLFENMLEQNILDETELYYRADANRFFNDVSRVDISQYMVHVEKTRKTEVDRLQLYLNPVLGINNDKQPERDSSSLSFSKNIISRMDKSLILEKAQDIISLGFKNMMNKIVVPFSTTMLESVTSTDSLSFSDDKLSDEGVLEELKKGFIDLRRMYILLNRVGALECLQNAFSTYLDEVGTQMVKSDEKDSKLIINLLGLKYQLDAIFLHCFKSPSDGQFVDAKKQNDAFASAIKNSFENFININCNRTAELLAKFTDSILKGARKNILPQLPREFCPKEEQSDSRSRSETELLLDKILVLFRYLSAKDIFEAFYKKFLSKRLLLNRSASIDLEKSVLLRLKAECGHGFVNRLEGMFRDLEVSKDIFSSFLQHKQESKKIKTSGMSVNVLTQGYWPSYRDLLIKLPTQMTEDLKIFEDFYLSRHSNKLLHWNHSLGSCVLRASYPGGEKYFSLSLFQGVVLLMFNDTNGEVLSYDELKNRTNLVDSELKRTLQSLAGGKVRVLKKIPKGREVNPTDEFHVVENFKNKLTKIRIPEIAAVKEAEVESDSTREQVLQDRQYQIDAAIVRIMKTRKKCSHQVLVQEVLEICSSSSRRIAGTSLSSGFPLTGVDIKKRIETLMEREFLERDPEDPNVYNYLA